MLWLIITHVVQWHGTAPSTYMYVTGSNPAVCQSPSYRCCYTLHCTNLCQDVLYITYQCVQAMHPWLQQPLVLRVALSPSLCCDGLDGNLQPGTVRTKYVLTGHCCCDWSAGMYPAISMPCQSLPANSEPMAAPSHGAQLMHRIP